MPVVAILFIANASSCFVTKKGIPMNSRHRLSTGDERMLRATILEANLHPTYNLDGALIKTGLPNSSVPAIISS